MLVKTLKTESENKFVIERIMYTRRYSLALDKEKCVGCEICKIVCPWEAIEIIKPIKIEGKKLSRPQITIDEKKCEYCGICNVMCPFGALTLKVNNKEYIPVLKTESFPQIIHEITIDETKCPIDCNICEQSCPFNLIKVSTEKIDNFSARVKVSVDKEHCPGCRLCEVKCPHGAIHVRKTILGSIKINLEKCPENCHDCKDVCPIPGVLIELADSKVHANDSFCVYCGACKIACPVEGALLIDRTSIHHTSVRSGAWNKALEKLSSTKDIAKELRSKSVMRTKNSVERLQGWRAT
ncbi:MAG: 4Fe-4S binding protein [Candidatus Bathyarchaeia archaeon]